ncbi:hypothetical protein [Streptomyces sp. NPDC040750]|uniref:hypothetical protein n=1 Tax=Streptomyces sp. NPDC040750 TaxID=3154491 RepID=UPI0033DD4EEF
MLSTVLRRRVSRRLPMAAAGLFTVRRKVEPGPAAALAEPVPQRPAAIAEEEGVSALFGSENRDLHTGERVVAVTFNAAWNDAVSWTASWTSSPAGTRLPPSS